MVVHILISGETQCEVFAQVCLVADYLSQKLPNFCYERIEKSVKAWPAWLLKINNANNWHHIGSPIIWKELLMKGSKPYYIGGAAEFLEYCHTYYNFDLFMSTEKYEDLVSNFSQFKKKMKEEELDTQEKFVDTVQTDTVNKNQFVITISGASSPLAMVLVSRLLDYTEGERTISKIFVYDEDCSADFMTKLEEECSSIGTNYPGKVVKYTDKIGNALTISDLLIVFDHVPFDNDKSIGEWLYNNMRLMQGLAFMINASASRSMYIILANVGPACFNATVLMHSVTINMRNVVVATMDLGLQIVTTISETYNIPSRTIFCPPVWGFVGINHLVGVRTTVHGYNSFDPYDRYTRVRNSTLAIGTLTPEMRTLEYLYHFDTTLWTNIAEKQKRIPPGSLALNKVVCIINLIRVWLLEPTSTDYIVSLGILCDGSFDLTFDGCFSQPARLHGREWRPAKEYFRPRDPTIKLPYLQKIAELMMGLNKRGLPPLIPFYPCPCKKKYFKKKEVWH